MRCEDRDQHHHESVPDIVACNAQDMPLYGVIRKLNHLPGVVAGLVPATPSFLGTAQKIELAGTNPATTPPDGRVASASPGHPSKIAHLLPPIAPPRSR